MKALIRKSALIILIATYFADLSAQQGESDFVRISMPSKSTNTGSTDVVKMAGLASDVDMDIPETGVYHPNRFALVIGNEDYSSFQEGLESEADVEFAMNDAKAFKLYANKVMGIPDENIILLLNATQMKMNVAIDKIVDITKSLKGEAEIYFYYAGHGLPHEQSKEPYIIPVDVSGSNIEYAIKLNDLYDKLNKYPSKRVTVFLDACFSGGGRNKGLVSARAVKIKPKENDFNGRMVVLSASSGNQTSLPFKEKQHGMFTYYLLKILQQTEGDITYQDLSGYVTKQTTLKSVMVNSKEQNPQTAASPDIVHEWKQWNVR